uniref:Uncharacterized protein n=1 Tax=Aegilops tauschii subsp. strangulata TaxID=200361 RepID=A0A453NZX2_AEGTS
ASPNFRNSKPQAQTPLLTPHLRTTTGSPPRAAAPIAPQPMAATSVGGEWEIEYDEGFVFKRPRVLYPDGAEDTGTAAPSTPAPDLESARLQRRRRALLHLRAKYQPELSRWESLSSDILAPPTAPTAATSGASSASPLPLTPSAATISSDHTILDDYLAEV